MCIRGLKARPDGIASCRARTEAVLTEALKHLVVGYTALTGYAANMRPGTSNGETYRGTEGQ